MRIKYIRKLRAKGESFMKKKLIIVALILASTAMFLPFESYAAASENGTSVILNQRRGKVNIQIGPGRGRGSTWNRGKHKGWHKGKHKGWDNRRTRTVRQVYWRNGVRYIRYVRVRA